MTPPREMPWVIPNYCEGCTSCVAVCPVSGLVMRPFGSDGFIPWMPDPEVCIGCGRCADVCGLGGIVMTACVDEAIARFRERLSA